MISTRAKIPVIQPLEMPCWKSAPASDPPALVRPKRRKIFPLIEVRTDQKRSALKTRCGATTASTASRMSMRSASAGVTRLPTPVPATAATAPANKATAVMTSANQAGIRLRVPCDDCAVALPVPGLLMSGTAGRHPRPALTRRCFLAILFARRAAFRSVAGSRLGRGGFLLFLSERPDDGALGQLGGYVQCHCLAAAQALAHLQSVRPAACTLAESGPGTRMTPRATQS